MRRWRRTHKYSAKPCVVDGIWFPSLKQGRRYRELKLAERAGVISDLQLEVFFPLVVCGKLICRYRADFVYFEDGKRVIEDSKGMLTDVFRLKKKLFEALTGEVILLT